MDVVLELYEDRPISVQLPEQVEATVVEADAVVKGQTASASYKPAILDNGVRVMVPPHITTGTRIVVDVYEREYVKRRSEEHTSELQSLMRISYAVFCLKKKKQPKKNYNDHLQHSNPLYK